MNCAKLCILCEKPKETFINLAKFHGICENENLDSLKFVKCKHCSSIVPIIKVQLEQKNDSFEPFPKKSMKLFPKSFAPIPIEIEFYKTHEIRAEVMKSNIAHIPPKKAKSKAIDVKHYPVFSNSDPHPKTSYKFKKSTDIHSDDDDEIFHSRSNDGILDSIRNSYHLNTSNNHQTSKDIEQVEQNPALIRPISKLKKLKFFLSRHYCSIIIVLIILSFMTGFLIIYFNS